MPDLVNKYLRNEKNILDLNKINLRSNKYIKTIANQYLKELGKISQKKMITDKLPLNFKWIGLIKLLLPNSKIIHCTRNPRDVCLSIFKNYFVNPNLKYAYNLEEISNYFFFYRNLMSHWKSALPGFIYEIKYEKIVQNPKFEIKKILKYLNLSWNKKCLEFYKEKRSVKTASDTQVRKKIYKSSINSWKNFEPYMKDFFNNLSD